jgi:hypothetical protein
MEIPESRRRFLSVELTGLHAKRLQMECRLSAQINAEAFPPRPEERTEKDSMDSVEHNIARVLRQVYVWVDIGSETAGTHHVNARTSTGGKHHANVKTSLTNNLRRGLGVKATMRHKGRPDTQNGGPQEHTYLSNVSKTSLERRKRSVRWVRAMLTRTADQIRTRTIMRLGASQKRSFPQPLTHSKHGMPCTCAHMHTTQMEPTVAALSQARTILLSCFSLSRGVLETAPGMLDMADGMFEMSRI